MNKGGGAEDVGLYGKVYGDDGPGWSNGYEFPRGAATAAPSYFYCALVVDLSPSLFCPVPCVEPLL